MNKENRQWPREVVEKNYLNIYLTFWVTFPESYVSYASFDKEDLISTPGYDPEFVFPYRILIREQVGNKSISFYSLTGVIPFILSFSENGEPSIKTRIIENKYDHIRALDVEPGMIWLDDQNVHWITSKTIQDNWVKNNIQKFESAKYSAELAGFTDSEINQMMEYHPKHIVPMLHTAVKIVSEYQIEKSKIISALMFVGSENTFVIHNYILLNHFSSSIRRSSVLKSVRKGISLNYINEILPGIPFVGDIDQVIKSLTLAIQKGVNFYAAEPAAEDGSPGSLEKPKNLLSSKKNKKVKIERVEESPVTLGDLFSEKLSALKARLEE